jgi:hypothetical protein
MMQMLGTEKERSGLTMKKRRPIENPKSKVT